MRRLSWSWFAAALLVMLVACTGGEQAERFAPIDPASSIQYDPYIVVMHGPPGAARAEANHAAAAEVARAYGLTAERTYGTAIVGFAARVPAGRLAALQRDPRVAYVETDDPVTIFAQEVPTGIRRIFADTNGNLDIDGTDDWRVDVDVAVIDTGIDFEHPDLNVVGGVNCSGGGPGTAGA
jgi:subtilisin